VAQAWHIDDIGVRILLGPLGNDFQPGCEAPFSIAFADRPLASGRHNGKAGTPHRRRVHGKY